MNTRQVDSNVRQSSAVLVVGGAGYIGAHMCRLLAEAGYRVTVFDNLSRGRRENVRWGELIEGDLRDAAALRALFAGRKFSAVLHFAALAYVGESVQQPQLYYENNVVGTLNLLSAMLAAGCRRLVFSSTCATYGEPRRVPIDEEHPQQPINPYGRTKLMVEQVLRDYAGVGLDSIALRYFNAAGCSFDGLLGECHDPETHLIPLVLREALRLRLGGARSATNLHIFGDDFATPDGTCIRDYIHVVDLCRAHLAALARLEGRQQGSFEAYNLGNGQGFSVLEVVAACRRVTGSPIAWQVVGRRAGDPPQLVGCAARAQAVLGWHPQHPSLDEIVASAWNWLLHQEQER